MMGEAAETGMLGACAAAPAPRAGARPLAAVVARAATVEERQEQAGLFEPEPRPLTVEEAREERRRGRPKGSTSLKTQDLARLAAALGADPHHWALRWLQLSPEELARRLCCKVSEAWDRQQGLARDLAPYFRPKLAPVDDAGRAVPNLVFVQGGAAGQPAAGPAVPPWVAALEADGVELVQNEQNQWVIGGAQADPHGSAPNGSEKP